MDSLVTLLLLCRTPLRSPSVYGAAVGQCDGAGDAGVAPATGGVETVDQTRLLVDHEAVVVRHLHGAEAHPGEVQTLAAARSSPSSSPTHRTLTHSTKSCVKGAAGEASFAHTSTLVQVASVFRHGSHLLPTSTVGAGELPCLHRNRGSSSPVERRAATSIDRWKWPRPAKGHRDSWRLVSSGRPPVSAAPRPPVPRARPRPAKRAGGVAQLAGYTEDVATDPLR